MGKHLRFEDKGFTKSGKTHIYHIFSAFDDTYLGEISWFSQWRQYIYDPVAHVIWSHECLLELSQYIKKLMEDRKN